jgi:glycerol-3-phosphate acyltransferase PlsY
MVLPALGTFILALLLFRYVSLGSVLAALMLWVTALGFLGARFCLPIHSRWQVLAWTLLVGLVVRKHGENLNRLVRGRETRFWGARKQAPDA